MQREKPMPVIPNESMELTPAMRRAAQATGRMGYAKVKQRYGVVGVPWTSETASAAARKGWTPERRAAFTRMMKENNPRSRARQVERQDRRLERAEALARENNVANGGQQ